MAGFEFIGILTAIITVGIGLAVLAVGGQHLADARADALGARLGARFDALGTRIDSLGGRTDSLVGRMGGVEARLLEVQKGQAWLEGFISGAGHPLGGRQPPDS